MKRIVLLVGPKGSGKSYIGTELARQFLVRFVRIEAVWQDIQHESATNRNYSWPRET
ncbi:AAA family ATPase [Pseudorhodoplanes sp.]|uniref:AAA family ATPase n=1 Tax=Pseudorhodoplanes sp. TaxID=1934341 RepID=UPI00391AFF2B